MKRDRTMKRRRQLARSLERAAVAERPFVGRGPRYLVQPSVASACAPSLRALAVALRDETRPVDEEGLAAVRTFILRGDSPFFGRDATEALREAVRLQHIVVGAETAVLDQEFRNLRRTAAAAVATIALAVAFAVLTVPSALAAGGCPCNEGLPSSGSYPQLKTSEGFSFKAPSYWNAAPSYWSTTQRTVAPITPRIGINRSLGVPPQYLGAGTQRTVPSALTAGRCPCNEGLPSSGQVLNGPPITPRIGVNRSLGVPPQYLGAGTQSQPTTPRLSDSPAGFDWSAAAIGAGAVAALFLMIGGIGAMTIRARKSQRSGRLSTT